MRMRFSRCCPVGISREWGSNITLTACALNGIRGTRGYNGVDWQAFVAGDVTSGSFEVDQFTGLGQAVVVSRFPAQMSNAAVTAG